MTQRYKALRGTKDILPDEAGRWLLLERTVRRVFSLYGFEEIRTPLIEATDLFARSVGASSDIVRKEMYTFGSGDDSVCLRPENTASVVRAFVEHSLYRRVAAGYPERYFYMGPMFRHERPQKGRQRQFHQIGVEVLGASESLADAETIQMADVLLQALGIGERELLLNSVGDAACRPGHRDQLRAWLQPRLGELCEDCNRRFAENPMRVFDCKVESDRELLREAPRIGDSLCDGCANHLSEVRRLLDVFGVAHRVDPGIVRGLDYYVRTVFEIVSPGLGAQNAILGGGRYDGLVEELGGPVTPGFGFAIGMERLILLMPNAEQPGRASSALALIGLGREGWEAAVLMARRLRGKGVACMAPLAERPMGAQLRRADKAGAKFALFVGKDELAAGRFGFKNLRTGEQVLVNEDEVAARVNEGR